MIRRARGFAPQPVFLAPPVSRSVLALGAHQKNAICLAREGHAFVSHHLGDLDTPQAVAALEEAVGHYERLFETGMIAGHLAKSRHVRPGLLLAPGG